MNLYAKYRKVKLSKPLWLNLSRFERRHSTSHSVCRQLGWLYHRRHESIWEHNWLMLLSHKKAPWRSYTKNYSYYRCESLTHTHIVLRINHIISAVDGKTASCITTNLYTHLLTIAVHSKHQARCCRHISYKCESKKRHFFWLEYTLQH